MSDWYEIKKVEDLNAVSISDDREYLDIYFDTNYAGAVYVSIKIKLIHEVIKDWLKEQEEK